MGVEVLVQIDRLVQLLETPVFNFLRLHLLHPARFPALLWWGSALLVSLIIFSYYIPTQTTCGHDAVLRLHGVRTYVALASGPGNSTGTAERVHEGCAKHTASHLESSLSFATAL